MSREVLKDLDSSATTLRESYGWPTSVAIAFAVPLSYARMVSSALEDIGVEIQVPEYGSEMSLEFRSQNMITLFVEDA